MWDAPADGGPVDSYRIDYSKDGKVWYSLDTGFDSTAYTDYEGLIAAETRHYRVFAVNSSGSSPPSASRSARTESSRKADAPTRLCATGMYVDRPEDAKAYKNCPKSDVKTKALKAQIRLSWDKPEDPEGAPVDKYRIEVSKNGRTFTTLKEVSTKDATDACNALLSTVTIVTPTIILTCWRARSGGIGSAPSTPRTALR